MLSFAFWTLYVLLLLCALILILLILIQKGRGGGLSSAFGGGGGGSAAFGAKTGDVLTWATSIIFGIFMVVAVCLNLVANARQANINAQAISATTVQLPTAPAPAGK
jgi:preprotein translocase subunit SecG